MMLYAGQQKVQRKLPRGLEQHLHQLQIRGRYGNAEQHELCQSIRFGVGFAGIAALMRSATKTCPKPGRFSACRLLDMA